MIHELLYFINASSSLEGVSVISGIQGLLTQGFLLARLPGETVVS